MTGSQHSSSHRQRGSSHRGARDQAFDLLLVEACAVQDGASVFSWFRRDAADATRRTSQVDSGAQLARGAALAVRHFHDHSAST